MSFNNFSELFYENAFVHRHLGKDASEQQALLKAVGFDDMDSFIDAVVPKAVRLGKELDLPLAMSEHNALAKLRKSSWQISLGNEVSSLSTSFLYSFFQPSTVSTLAVAEN